MNTNIVTILVPGTVLNALQILTHLFLLTWWGRHWNYHSRPRPYPRSAFTVPSRGRELTKLSYFSSHGLKNLFFKSSKEAGKGCSKKGFHFNKSFISSAYLIQERLDKNISEFSSGFKIWLTSYSTDLTCSKQFLEDLKSVWILLFLISNCLAFY